MKNDFIRERQEGQLEALNTIAERMINAGKAGDEISLFTNHGRKDIDSIAYSLNCTVSWNEVSA